MISNLDERNVGIFSDWDRACEAVQKSMLTLDGAVVCGGASSFLKAWFIGVAAQATWFAP